MGCGWLLLVHDVPWMGIWPSEGHLGVPILTKGYLCGFFAIRYRTAINGHP